MHWLEITCIWSIMKTIWHTNTIWTQETNCTFCLWKKKSCFEDLGIQAWSIKIYCCCNLYVTYLSVSCQEFCFLQNKHQSLFHICTTKRLANVLSMFYKICNWGLKTLRNQVLLTLFGCYSLLYLTCRGQLI